MARKNAFNTVTPLSKGLAFIMFVTFPFVGFYMGMQYQKTIDKPLMKETVKDTPIPPPGEGIACTMEVLECPDGTYVGRVGPNCEFDKCP